MCCSFESGGSDNNLGFKKGKNHQHVDGVLNYKEEQEMLFCFQSYVKTKI